jgi:hypothetical protein
VTARLLTAVIAVAIVAAPRAQQPPRDAPRAASGSLVISGRVFAADGKTPLRRAIVRIASADLPKTLAVRTDDAGRYEFGDLPAAGSFTLTAAKTQHLRLEYGQRRPFEPGRQVVLAGKSLSGVDFQLPRAAAIAGMILDTSGDPIDQLWVMAFRRSFVDGRRRLTSVGLAVTNDIGQYRLSGLAPGDYYVVVRERAAAMTEFSRETTGYPVSFHPGTPDLQQAQPIRLAVGQQMTGVNLTLSPARAATITGQVVRADGRPASNASLSLMDHSGSGPGGNINGGATANAEGSFRIAGVRAGSYYLGAGADKERGYAELEVTGADVTGLTIVIGTGGTIAARIVSASGTPLSFAASRVEMSARPLVDPFLVSGAARPATKPDWTIQWIGLTGPRAIRATRTPDGWWMKAVLRGDRDVTDDVIEVTHGQAIRDLTIVLDDKPTRISGAVRDDKGTAVADYTVIAFSEDARRWTQESRYVQAVRPDHAGAYRLSALPPGPYLIAAVDYVEQGQWLDPEYLESLRRRATRVTLEAGQRIDVSLTLIAGGVQ